MYFIDSNIVLRFLLSDHPEFSPRARAFFRRLEEGTEQGILLESVLVEVTFTLTSKRTYARPQRIVADGLIGILEIPSLSIRNRNIHLNALELFGDTRLDYLDCLHVSTARLLGPTAILSFDRDFDKFEGITRVEP